MAVPLWVRRSRVLRALAAPALHLRRAYREQQRAPALAVWERLRDQLAGDVVLQVDEFDGAFALDPRSHVLQRLLLDGVYEPHLAAVCRAYADPARDAVDVGANAGFFSVALAKHLPGRRVLAAEPSAPMLRRLRDNLARNGVADRVVVFDGAVSDRPGRVQIRSLPGLEEYGTIGQPAHPALQTVRTAGAEVTIDVEAVPLDTLVERHGLDVGFLKVDVEGVEHLVFDGARSLLRTARPVVLTELMDPLLRANGSSAMDVVDLFHAHDYRVLAVERPGRPEVTRAMLETPHEVEEVLCLPRA